MTNWESGDFLIGKLRHRNMNAQMQPASSALTCITVNISHLVSYSTVCVVVHVQLIYMLHYKCQRQRQCISASVPLGTRRNAWMLTHTHTHVLKQTMHRQVIFNILASGWRCRLFLINLIQRQKSDVICFNPGHLQKLWESIEGNKRAHYPDDVRSSLKYESMSYCAFCDFDVWLCCEMNAINKILYIIHI